MPCSWVRRLNIIKSIFPRIIYRQHNFDQNGHPDSKIYMEMLNLYQSQNNFEKEEQNLRALQLPKCKTYYSATVSLDIKIDKYVKSTE